MNCRRNVLVLLSGILIAACGPEAALWEVEQIEQPAATVGCGDGVVTGNEECDGASDGSCPGQCSAQCACPAVAPRANLEVHMMDVGQGDGLVVVSPDGFVMLVDAGNDGNQSSIISYLSSIGVSSLDYTVVSHQHADHLGSVDHLINTYPEVVASFDNGNTAGSIQYQEYDTTAGARRVTVGPGDTIDMGPSVQVDVLHGDANASGENDNSVVLRITHGTQTFLLGGDCENDCEAGFDPGQIDVYKAHHHGSNTSSSDLLLGRMQPTETALISCGAGNSYGHPRQEPMDRMLAHGMTIHRTDLEGPLAVQSDGVSHVVNGQLSCTDNDTRSCGASSVGACRLGTQTCIGGAWSSCSGNVDPVAENCSNGVDDDCDGSTDGADCDCAACVGNVLIAQVGYDTPGTDSAEEFVDLYNPTGATVDLSGWSISDGAGSWTIPGGTTIASGQYLSIARQAAGFLALHGFDADVVGMSISLNNGGDKLDLKDNTATVVDHVAWEGYEAGWSITAGTGDSIERTDVNSDTDSATDWSITSPASPRGGPSLCNNDADCDDGQYCNGAETCDSVLGCQAGTPVTCSDGIACTADSCNEAIDACESTANDSACDDGLYCNGAETCDSVLGCQAGTAITCDDGVACTSDACDEGADACAYTPDDGVCDNGLYCDGSETCDPLLGCVAGSAVVCNDGVSCTIDSCDEAADACAAATDDAACDDGLFCNGVETCDAAGGCLAGSDPCVGQACDESSDTCANCLSDADCDDGNDCNGVETCSGGACQVGAPNPVPEVCDNGQDDDCDGQVDLADGDCAVGLDHVIISQVHYDTPGTDSVEEFVDLYNPTGSAVSLDGWTLADNAGSWSFPAGTVIGAGSFLSVARDSAGFSALYGSNPDVTGMTLSLNNTGDALILRDAGAANVDHVAWEDFEPGWSIVAPSGSSIERSDVSSDSDTVSDWQTTTPASPRGGATPACLSDSACDDGDACNGAETCDPVNGCQAGTALSCDDGDGCTIDSCNPDVGCEYAPDPVCVGQWTELFNDDFESGWGPYTDGGSDARRSANDAAYAHQGSYCVRIRDNSGAASSFYSTNGFDLSGYGELQIAFWYRANSMENGEDFFVEFWDGGTWQIVASYVSGTDFNNGVFYNPTVTIDSGSHSFGSGAKLRFRADASGNNDQVYIDEVVVSAR